MAQHKESLCTQGVGSGEFAMLAFVQHMATNARSAAGRQLFELCAYQERQRLAAAYRVARASQASANGSLAREFPAQSPINLPILLFSCQPTVCGRFPKQ